jgi:hypothetical protein
VLTRYFAGDVGADPGAFGPLTGTASGDTLRAMIPRRGSPLPGIALGAMGTGDTLSVTLIVLGPDTVASERGPWRLVRR